MMREIKFRGMSINGELFIGNLAIISKRVEHLKPGSFISNSVGMPFAYEVRPETVGQSTGLHDSKGLTELWEGDIIGLDGIKKGDKYENPDLLEDTTNLVIEGMGTKTWRNTEQKAMERGCHYAERNAIQM